MQITLEDCQMHMNRVPVNQYFNIQFIDIREGYSKIKMPYNPVFTNSWKNTHGGALLTLADIAFYFAMATMTGLEATGNLSTAELKTNFLNPTSQTDLYAEARVIKNGRRLIFGDVKVLDEEGKSISHSTVTYIRRG